MGDLGTGPAPIPTPVAHPRGGRRRRQLGSSGIIGGAGLAVIVLAAALAPVLAPHDPSVQHLGRALHPGFWAASGDWRFPLGTDTFGRDLLSRLLFGARVSLLVGAGITLAACAAGAMLGLLAGYYRKGVDLLISGLSDVLLSIPAVLLAVVVVALLGPGLDRAMVAVTIVQLPRAARIVRSATLVAQSQEFVSAAHALGATSSRIIWRHIVPNVVPPVVVQASFTMASAVGTIAGLGFLGLGAQPPTAELGTMLSEGRKYLLQGNWWYSGCPGAAIMLTVLALNLVGDALQARLDPRLRRARRETAA